ncbi:elongation factor P hydroxylase [Pseudomaricurvus alcaniphilus]|uniref:elongation factor P hydroxylase n=1 Tax=Pseudomaricurvus alcaniphilus TaxID=1166482 RepID=UPI00140B75D2|nr:elongation factor P hydroxylase [Pseudomaricurvus alcaniphilus]NHN36280.1 elongation factor P hydroxylase [Pseudomaricurvus alcaniphilus]
MPGRSRGGVVSLTESEAPPRCLTPERPLPEAIAPEPVKVLDAGAIEAAFQQVFLQRYQTVLQGNGDEPLYLPASGDSTCHRIIYRHDYAASALHEVAHWCVAGARRRQLEDYGYWYAADGRSSTQQAEFERVEVKPQALEWLFSVAAGRDFKVSADNLAAGLGPSLTFKQAIYQQVLAFCGAGLPRRAAAFVAALARQSGVGEPLNPAHYRLHRV